MKIAILGTRGVPPTYGGFETFAAELGVRLAARGHEVTVYCRGPRLPGSGVAQLLGEPRLLGFGVAQSLGESPPATAQPSNSATSWNGPELPVGKGRADALVRPRGEAALPRGGADEGVRPSKDAPATAQPSNSATSWNGLRRIVLPSIGGKYFETVSHTFFSALDALRRDFDAVLVCNAANAFVLPLLRAARIPVAINVDGIERRRRKWNILGRAVYAIGEAFSVHFATVVADAEVIAGYYRSNYAIEPEVIPYGADFPNEPDSDVLHRLGIEPRGYILYVSRFEPENNPLEVVQAYEKLSTQHSALSTPLAMLGQGLYAPDLVKELKTHEGPNILFPGALYGADYRTLQRNALAYIQATEVGGTHPALIEAMGSGGAVLALDTPENREVGGDAIGYFSVRPVETLSGTLREFLANRSEMDSFRERARRRARERYGWKAVTESYERLFLQLA